jgi:hypothetical protein
MGLGMASPATTQFLKTKGRSLAARTVRLANLTPEAVGIRPQDRPYAPSAIHFQTANRRLQSINRQIQNRLDFLRRNWQKSPPGQVLLFMALVEREIDRVRRAFGLFFEIFSQRGSVFAPNLAAYDVIAQDCYMAIRKAAPLIFRGPLVKPLTYMEHGYSPATMRRGVLLSRLLGEANPFPVIRIPWDQDNPWQAVFLHEVSHNIQADLGLWHENQQAVGQRVLKAVGHPLVTTIYRRWHKEIFADLAAILLGGPASAWGMMDFLAHPAPRTLTYRPGGAHPTGFLRAFIMAEMVKRLGFPEDAARMQRVWNRLFNPRSGHRIPAQLLQDSSRTIAHVVDEVTFQTRRNLAQRALVDVIPFRPADEEQIRRAARALSRGLVPPEVPPRFLVSASYYANKQGASLSELSQTVISHLSRMATGLAPASQALGLAAA